MNQGHFTTDAEYWATEVKSYIFARMDALWHESGRNPAAVTRFLEALARGTGHDLGYLATLYHIARSDGAWEYLTTEVPRGVRTLAHAGHPIRQSNRGALRGRIAWPQTVLARSVRKDPSYFATVGTTRTYDVPENRFLKHYLTQIAELEVQTPGPGREETVGGKLAASVAASRDALKSSYLRELPQTHEVSSLMLARAGRHKRHLYGKLPELWKEYEGTVLGEDLDAIRSVISDGFLAPRTPDELFELFVLVQTLKSFETLLAVVGPLQVTYGLVRAGGQAIALMEAGDFSVEVWFDRSPDEAFSAFFKGAQYRYKEVLDCYEGLSGTARRPDVLVSIVRKNVAKPIFVLIEAKYTSATSEYGRESLYKVFAYTKDFEDLWDSKQTPKAILAFPSGVEPTDPEAWLRNDVVVISGDIEKKLRRVVSFLIQTL